MHNHRRGFTKIELAVVIVIVVILFALFFPAVQTSHITTRRDQCKNNLKMIGLALHNYHETFKTFPPGWVSSNQYGWSTMILPNLDQAPLFNKLNFDVPWATDFSNPIQVVQVFRCPSASVTTIVDAPPLTVPAARSNYPAVSGDKLISDETVFTSVHGGAFGENSGRTFKDFEDGLSNSILVGERRSSNADTNNPGGETIWVGVRDNHSQQGQAFAIGDCNTGNLMNYQGPNRSSITGFSSPHQGGAHFLLGDGSVRFISEKLSPTIYANLANIADGNVCRDF